MHSIYRFRHKDFQMVMQHYNMLLIQECNHIQVLVCIHSNDISVENIFFLFFVVLFSHITIILYMYITNLVCEQCTKNENVETVVVSCLFMDIYYKSV